MLYPDGDSKKSFGEVHGEKHLGLKRKELVG